MSFWLATINPGRKRKRVLGKKRRRTLSAWQRAVRKHGGVMAAVKARRKHKRRKVKVNKRRSAVSRGRLRGRPRIHGRRNAMARVRRARRRRHARRNDWKGQPRRHARAAKLGWSRRRRRKGAAVHRRRRSAKVHSFTPARAKYAANPKRRRSRRRYRKNAVIPVSWNPKRRRRSYRRNALLPYFAMNPASAAMDPVSGILARAKQFINVDFWTKTAVPVAGGYIGSRLAGKFISDGIKGYVAAQLVGNPALVKAVEIGSEVLGVSAMSWAAGRFLGKDLGDKVFLGGVVSIAHAVVKMLLDQIAPTISAQLGLSGLGSDLSERMKAAVSQRVARELQGYGMGAYLSAENLRAQRLNGLGEYVTDTALRSQRGYAPTPGGDLRDYDVNRTETTF